MRNYIELENDYEVFKIGIDLCINKLDLQELAITIADRGLLAFLND